MEDLKSTCSILDVKRSHSFQFWETLISGKAILPGFDSCRQTLPDLVQASNVNKNERLVTLQRGHHAFQAYESEQCHPAFGLPEEFLGDHGRSEATEATEATLDCEIIDVNRGIEGEIERKTGKTFCPPGGKKMTVTWLQVERVGR